MSSNEPFKFLRLVEIIAHKNHLCVRYMFQNQEQSYVVTELPKFAANSFKHVKERIPSLKACLT